MWGTRYKKGSTKAEDTASANGDQLNIVGAKREDALGETTSSNGDYQPFKSNNKGAIYTEDVNSSGNATNIAAILSALGAGITVGGTVIVATAEFSRPADVNGYEAKDVISDSTSSTTPLEFVVASVASATGYITKARVTTSKSTATQRLRLWLFSSLPSAPADNSQFMLLWAERTTRIGYIDFPALSTEGTGSDSASAQNIDVRLPFQADSGKKIYGLLETLDTFASSDSQQRYYVELLADNNLQ